MIDIGPNLAQDIRFVVIAIILCFSVWRWTR